MKFSVGNGLPWAAAAQLASIISYAQASDAIITEGAAAKVTSISSAGAPYFKYETRQLTDEVIERLSEDPDLAADANLFDFDHGADADEEALGGLPHHRRCKVFPGDNDWPTERIWDKFEKLLGGKKALIPTTPLAAPCYPDRPEYSPEKCEEITARWSDAYLHEGDPTSVMWPLWQGRTCLPVPVDQSGAENATCTLGGYPVAAVNVSTVAQVQLAVNFARNAGLRLVIKNTGHCFLGKSAGAGALAIWLHNLGGIEFLPRYHEPGHGGYAGKAIKVGPAVTVLQAYEFAHEHEVSVLGGIAESVGFGGGYLQGGGHTPLSGLYGMASDQILAFEVVTADGRFVTASRARNEDLFWALRGGGGGTFGVVTSTIVRAHPKVPVVTSFYSFETSANVSVDTFFAGLRAYFDHFVPFTDAHTYGYFYITPGFDGADGSYRFEMVPFFAPNYTIASFEALVRPLFDRLRELGIPFTPDTRRHDAFLPAFRAAWTQGPVGTYVMPGNRLFPRSSFATPRELDRTFGMLRTHLEKGRNIVGYHQAPRNRLGVDNAVGPAWRNAVAYLITEVTASATAKPDEVRALQHHLDREVMAPWREIAPASRGGGAYLNEANPMEQDWQAEFYGADTYARLLRVKRRRDPRDLFYATTAVGSERWEVRSEERDGVLTQNGRLCRV